MKIGAQYINDFFGMLNQSGLRYVLIKNIADELPDALENGKDIDILVHSEDHSAFRDLMKAHHFVQVTHPCGSDHGWRFGYLLEEAEFWRRTDIEEELFIDVNFKLCCHSFIDKVWIPLNREIDSDVWERRTFNMDKQWWQMDDETTLIYLIVRSIFDKQEFRPGYIEAIERRINKLEVPDVADKLSKAFFKFTPTLIEMLKNREYDEILDKYLKFTDY